MQFPLEIAVFIASSETFSRRNINCSIDESLQRVKEIFDYLHDHPGIRVRGYLSCVWGCPFEGAVDPLKVIQLTEMLLEMGCYEVSLGDTIGVAHAGSTLSLLDNMLPIIPSQRLAMHFHDTYGQALANILISLDKGQSMQNNSFKSRLLTAFFKTDL